MKLIKVIGLSCVMAYIFLAVYAMTQPHNDCGCDIIKWTDGKVEGRTPNKIGEHSLKNGPILYQREPWANVLYVYNDFGSLEYRVINPKLQGHPH